MLRFIQLLSCLCALLSIPCSADPLDPTLNEILNKGPSNTSDHNGFEYAYFNKANLTYARALELCKLWNGSLATIKDNATQVHIQTHMPSYATRSFYIIGLMHANETNHTALGSQKCFNELFENSTKADYPTWVWSDGSPLNESGYTNWKTDPLRGFSGQEPNGCKVYNGSMSRHSPYVQISALQGPNYGKWYDKHVNSEWLVICERKMQMAEATTAGTTLPDTTTPETTTSAALTTATTTVAETTTSVTTSVVTMTAYETRQGETEEATTPLPTTSEPTTMQDETTEASPRENISSIMDNLLKSFSVQDWETNGAKLIAEALLSQPGASAQSYDYPDRGIKIKLQTVNATSIREKNVSLEVSPDPGDSVTINSDEFASLSDDVALVTASFTDKAYETSGLSSASPLTDVNDQRVSDQLESEVSILPKNVKVISVSLYKPTNKTGSAEKVSIPVRTTFNLSGERTLANLYLKQKRRVVSSTPKCVFYNTGDKQSPSWSGSGCQLLKSEGEVATCSCNHTTSFGIIFAVISIKVPSEVDLLIIALEIISVLALTITVSLLLWLRKRLHRDRTWIQINLSASLLLLHFFFLMGTVAINERDPRLCEAFTVLSHYFTLTTALWMFNEGLVLHLKTGKRALKFSVTRVLPRLLLLAWGFPFLYVLICATIGLLRGVYMDVRPGYRVGGLLPKYDSCWLGFRHNMIYSAIVPLVLIFAATTVLLVKISLAINKMSKEALKLRPSVVSPAGERGMTPASSIASIPRQKERILMQVKVTFKAAVTLLPVLGVPWLIAFLVNIPGAQVPFLIIHGIVNGLQGIFVFIIYCARSKQFRLVLKRKWKQMPSSTQSFSLNRFSSGYPS